MDARRRLRWPIILLVIISLHDSGWVLGASHGNQSGGRRKLAPTEGRHSFLYVEQAEDQNPYTT